MQEEVEEQEQENEKKEEDQNAGGGRGAGEGGGDAARGGAMQQRAWEGAAGGNLKEKLGEPENGSLGILKE